MFDGVGSDLMAAAATVVFRGNFETALLWSCICSSISSLLPFCIHKPRMSTTDNQLPYSIISSIERATMGFNQSINKQKLRRYFCIRTQAPSLQRLLSCHT